MNGVVEFADNEFLSGWLAGGDSSFAILYLLSEDRSLIASWEVSLTERPDLGGRGKSFKVETPAGFVACDLATGRAILSVNLEGTARLQLWAPLRAALAAAPLSGVNLQRYLSLLPKRLRSELVAFDTGSQPAEGSSVEPIIGRVSMDQASVVGRDGHLFLFRGSNDVASLYSKETSKGLTDSWANLVGERERRSSGMNAHLVQLLLPEKTSALSELVPYPCATGSPQFLGVLKGLANFRSTINGLAMMRSNLARESCFRKLDSHLSSAGCCSFVEEVLRHIGCMGRLSVTGVYQKSLRGDLAWRLPDLYPAGLERVLLAEGLAYDGAVCGDPKLVDFQDVVGGHVGTRRRWINDGAPIRLKAVCFGNSFFERGNHSTALSWWFSRLFVDFTFIWSAEIDWKLTRELKPDVLVAQTIERFMARVPET